MRGEETGDGMGWREGKLRSGGEERDGVGEGWE